MIGARRSVHVWATGDAEGSDIAARRVLERYGLTFGRDVCGRPVAVGAPGVGVSVSHSGGMLLVGVAAGCRVGVDVEQLAERGLARLPAHALAAAELGELERSGGDRASTFLSYWTRKEALLKAAGVGVAIEPCLIELGPPGGSPRPAVLPEALGPPSRWTIAELPLPGLRAAVAAEAPAIELRLYVDNSPAAGVGFPELAVDARCRMPLNRT